MRATRVAITRLLLRRRAAVGSWAARIPAVQEPGGPHERASSGSRCSRCRSGALVVDAARRLAVRSVSAAGRVTVAALFAVGASLVLVSLADDLAGSPRCSSSSGPGSAAINVAANAQGLALERRYGRPILSSFHAAFSAGALAGAGLGAMRGRPRRRRRARTSACSLSRSSSSCWSSGRRLLPPGGGRRRARRIARPPAPFAARARCGGVLHAPRRGRRRRLERRLPLRLGRRDRRRRRARIHGASRSRWSTSRLAGDRPERAARPGRARARRRSRGRGRARVRARRRLDGGRARRLRRHGRGPRRRRAGALPRGRLDARRAAGVGVAAVSTIGWLGFLAGPPVIGLVAGRRRAAERARARRRCRSSRLALLARSAEPAPATVPRSRVRAARGPLRPRRRARRLRRAIERTWRALRGTARARCRARSRAEPRPAGVDLDPPRRAPPRRRGGGSAIEQEEIDAAPGLRALPGARELVESVPAGPLRDRHLRVARARRCTPPRRRAPRARGARHGRAGRARQARPCRATCAPRSSSASIPRTASCSRMRRPASRPGWQRDDRHRGR